MDGRKKYLKALAFVPAIVLAGGFVGYRAGAFPTDFFRPSAKPEPQPAPQADPTPAGSPELAPPSVQPVDPTFMAGSKSIILVPAPQQPGATPPTPSPVTNPAIIYGSKSAPIFPAQPTAPAPNAPKP
jgi:hypothetical protein